LHTIVQTALEQYDLRVSEFKLIGKFTNTLFHVLTTDGEKYVLRICTPNWRTVSDIQSEVIWLEALDKDTDIGAPKPIISKSGEGLISVAVDGNVYHCLLMSWLSGDLLAKDLSEDNLYLMGKLFAGLHQHTDTFKPTQGFTTRKMDNIYARDEEDVLLSETHRQAFSAHALAIYQEVLKRVNKAFEDLYSDTQGLKVIHNDLHHENIKIDGDILRPFDFEDTIWGYAVQDIAMGLQDLMREVEPEQYPVLQAALRDGYESLRQWPEVYDGQIDTFRVGRMLWVANYVARYHTQHLEEHIKWTLKPFTRFLETGVLKLG